MNKKKCAIVLLFGLVLSFSFFSNVFCQADDKDEITDDEVNEIAHDMYCPICENVPLDVCATEACAQWREQIRQYLAQGWSEREIKEHFANQYGWNVLAVPPKSGFNWFFHIIPPVIAFGGVAIVIYMVRKAKTNTPTGVYNTSHAIDKDIMKMVEKDIENQKGR